MCVIEVSFKRQIFIIFYYGLVCVFVYKFYKSKNLQFNVDSPIPFEKNLFSH